MEPQEPQEQQELRGHRVQKATLETLARLGLLGLKVLPEQLELKERLDLKVLKAYRDRRVILARLVRPDRKEPLAQLARRDQQVVTLLLADTLAI